MKAYQVTYECNGQTYTDEPTMDLVAAEHRLDHLREKSSYENIRVEEISAHFKRPACDPNRSAVLRSNS